MPAGNEHQGCMRRSVPPASQILNLPYVELHSPQIQDIPLETLFVGCFKYNSAQCIDGKERSCKTAFNPQRMRLGEKKFL